METDDKSCEESNQSDEDEDLIDDKEAIDYGFDWVSFPQLSVD